MKKLRFRFAAYFTAGLFIFLIYFIILSISLIGLLYPGAVQGFVYVAAAPGSYFPALLILAFCFITGGILFSLFFAQPLSFIIGTIGKLSKGDYTTDPKAFQKNGKLKCPYFLYQEVIAYIETLRNTLRKAEIEREQLEAAKRDWIAGVSHDLKTPLSYINGYSSLLLNENYSFSEDETRTYLGEIYKKGAYTEKLIDDLNLTFFINDAGKVQLKNTKIEIVGFLKNLLADVANDPKAEKQELRFYTELEYLHVVIDEMLMYRAIYNLMINCVEHNPAGTKIYITLKLNQQTVYIDITDNGIGMDQETADNIFDKYYSSKSEQTQGRGLGLFIAKQIIEAQGGSISLSSAVGKGTSFHIHYKRISRRL